MENKQKKAWYKKWWVIALIIFLVIFGGLIVIGVISPLPEEATDTKPKKVEQTETKTEKQTETKETPKQSKEEPKPKKEYKKLATKQELTVRTQHHYLFTGSSKPSQEKVKSVLLELEKTCSEDDLCEFMLWETESAYNNRDNSDAYPPDYVENNKEFLAGYLNSGGAIWYYGKQVGYSFD